MSVTLLMENTENEYYTNKSKKEEKKNDDNEQIVLGNNREIDNSIKVNFKYSKINMNKSHIGKSDNNIKNRMNSSSNIYE